MPRNQSSFNSKSCLSRLLGIVEAAFVIADLNPVISEPIRFGSLFAAEGIFHNFYISAVVFGIVTLLLDALGAVAVADLLDRKMAARLVDKTNELVKKAKLTKLLNKKTDLAVDFSITLLVGTPITLMLKQLQNPSRSRNENMRLGLMLSAAASLVSAVQGGAIVAGLFHPNVLNVLAAAVAIASFVIVQRLLRKKFS